MIATKAQRITMVQDHIRESSPCHIYSVCQWAESQGLDDVYELAMIEMFNTKEATICDDVIELL